MVEVDKTYSENPFVDETIYYCKLLALNAVVKDEEEALNNETLESQKAGDLYIACVEGRAKYEMFKSFPEEILEKYIPITSNIDLLVDSDSVLNSYITALGVYERTALLNNLGKLARTIYIDHYNIMKNYIDQLGPTWLIDNESLYEASKNNTATYIDLFDIIPEYTRYRMLKQYIRNYDDTDISELASDINIFQNYIDNRADGFPEISYINKAMCSCFASHYEMIVERKYLSDDYSENTWQYYYQFPKVFDMCISGTATYKDLYLLFPSSELEKALDTINVSAQGDHIMPILLNGVDELIAYFNSGYADEDTINNDIKTLNATMREMYILNYNLHMNYDVYNRAVANTIDFLEIKQYIPRETLKIIFNAYIQEITNIATYSNYNNMLDSYLNTLNADEADRIKENITREMMTYYVDNYKELNNYYRIVMGLPPLENGKIMEDTLVKSYSSKYGEYIRFGDTLIDMIPKGIYPEIHWRTAQIYEFDNYDISILHEYGVIDKFLELVGSDYNDKRYRYLMYLGDNALDIYTCRKALNFDLMHLPTIDNTDIKEKFIDKYEINADYVIRTVYTEAYKFQSDYYNKFIIMFILINTIMDVLSEVPEMIINKQIFDSRSIKYLFESVGIPFYPEIPVKYQQAMLRNLNILIKYKSSDRNMIDICSLFGFDDIRVFGYYMLKERIKDAKGNFIFKTESIMSYELSDLYVIYPAGDLEDENGVKYISLDRYYNMEQCTHIIKVLDDDNNIIEKRIVNDGVNCYILNKNNTNKNEFIPIQNTDYYERIREEIEPADIKFIRVPIDDNVTNYKNDDEYISEYDTIVMGDETWDGGLNHDYVKRNMLNSEFNIALTKYISIETITHMTELSFQVSYFYSMLFDNLYSEENLTVEIPYINNNHKFKFVDVVCYLFSLMYLYNNIEDRIMFSPTQALYIKDYKFREDTNDVIDNTIWYDKDFSVNQQILENDYDYNEAFKIFGVRSFNLNADIDELDRWLNRFRLSLDDFIVDDTLTTFDHIITLRDFYSLNNSYYQKDIFNNDNVYVVPYNQDIKYAYGAKLFEKFMIKDVNEYIHEYIINDGYHSIVVDDQQTSDRDVVYILNNSVYALYNGHEVTALYNKFDRATCNMTTYEYYTLVGDGEYKPLLDNSIYIKDKYGDYVLSSDAFYIKTDDGAYIEISDPKYFIEEELDDGTTRRVLLNVGDYFQDEQDSYGNYLLVSDNDYVKWHRGKAGTASYEEGYILASDIYTFNNIVVPDEELYVLKNDNKFIRFIDTDFYNEVEDDIYAYEEDYCYIKSDAVTEYQDSTTGEYYRRLIDYYEEVNYVVDESMHYIKDFNGNYIPITELITPDNCYIEINDSYHLAKNYYTKYIRYDEPINIRYMYLLDTNNNYTKYNYSLTDDISVIDDGYVYINESSEEYVLAVPVDDNYADTNEIIIIFNHAINAKSFTRGDDYEGYDPERSDGVWDENDWFYQDPSYDNNSRIGMNGENKWYYRKPGVTNIIEEDEPEFAAIASGFYIPAEAYLGSIELIPGEKYYMALDIETNFEGKIRIANEADNSDVDLTSRMYDIKPKELIHISQVFNANDNTRPNIIFYIYNYEDYPIEIGDYIVVKNIRMVKSYSNNYIPQDIPSFDKLQEIYKVNEAIYKYLANMMVNATDMKTYSVFKVLYDSLMVSKYNKEMFKLVDGSYAETYTDFLQTRDSVLYERLTYFKSLDGETMKKAIADNIIEVTYAIDNAIDTYSYGYLYSYFPAVSASYIQQYIKKIINFFKSWKAHLLGINTVYKFDDKLENTIKILEDQFFRNTLKYHTKVNVNGFIKINPIGYVDNNNENMKSNTTTLEDDENYTNLYEFDQHTIQYEGEDIPRPVYFIDRVTGEEYVPYKTHKFNDKVDITDEVKMLVKADDHLEYHDNEIDLVLQNDFVHANVDSNGILEIRGNKFSTGDNNNLMEDTLSDNDLFLHSQSIMEINDKNVYRFKEVNKWK